MNIAEAKQRIKETVIMYHQTDCDGNLLIPVNKQRPIALMGPLGIGKTEITAQVAAELGIGYLSYSITHHTRQSAVGLPMIYELKENGEKYYGTQYTVSEIILEVYKQASNGVSRGILFLDEFNAVSETLAPAMLSFLQTKNFGNSRLPDGWIIIVAGNPNALGQNKSAKELDAVLLDRLRIIDVSGDLNCWMDYAYEKGFHPLVITFLRHKPENFVIFEKNRNGYEVVSPRSWEDLSITLQAREHLGFEITADVVAQVVQCKRVVDSFMNFYALYRTLAANGEVEDILNGKNIAALAHRFSSMDFCQRYALICSLMDSTIAYTNQLEEGSEVPYENINCVITNCLTFLVKAFDKGPETTIYLDLLIKNKRLALTLVNCRNEIYELLCDEILFSDPDQRLKKEVRKAV